MSYNTYPAQLPNLPDLTVLSQVGTNCSNIDLQGTTMRQWMAAVADYVLAIATAVGTTGSTDVSSITYKLAHVITNDVPRAQVYSGGVWVTPSARPKLFIAQSTDPNPSVGTNDITFRKRVE